MPKRNDSWGIEVGASALKAIRLVKKGEELVVADYAAIPFKKVLTTPDINVDEQIQVVLDEFMTTHPKLGQSTVVISVPGHAGIARFAKLPPVAPKEIPKIVQFEAGQQIPFPLLDVQWDYQVFTQPDSPDVELGLFAITNAKVKAHLVNFEKVGLKPDGLVLSPVAVFNAIVYDHDRDADVPGVVMVDIGTTSTDVIVHEAGKLWLRTLNIGGNNFTEALVKAFKLSFPKAEKLKREASTSKYARQIFTAMRPVFADFVQELQRSLGYYQNLNREARLDKLIGLGSTFRLPGLQKFLKQQLQIEIMRPDGFSRLTVEGKQQAEFAEHTINLATAYGCALQGLGLETISANLLPKENVRERVWAAKRPWFIGAAAAFALPVLLVWGLVYGMKRGYEAESKQSQTLEDVVSDANQHFDTQLNELTLTANLTSRIDQYRQMLDYRSVWPKLLADINAAAESVNPDPEAAVYHANYEAVRAIPRQQRNRVYIDTIESDYTFAADPTTDDLNTIFNPPQDMNMGGMGGARPEPGPMGAGNFGPKGPPGFQINIKGYVTDLRYIDQFVDWLRKNSDLPDRPYRIELAAMPYTATLAQSEITAPTGTTKPKITGGGHGHPFHQMPSMTPRPGILDSMPVRPLLDENRSTDFNFDLVLTVRLRPPGQAGAGPNPPAPAEPQPQETPASDEHEAAQQPEPTPEASAITQETAS